MKAIFVDFDGTLVDSMPFLFAAYTTFLEGEGSVHEFEELTGSTLKEIVSHLKKKYSLKGSQKTLLEFYCHLLEQQYAKAKPMPGALQQLKVWKKKGVKIILVSSAYKRFVDVFFHKNKLKSLFDLVVTGDEVTKGKPDPALYILALKKAKVEPGDAMAIEDSQNGEASAIGAGMPVQRLTSWEKLYA